MRWARWVGVGALLCGLAGSARATDQKPVLYSAVVTAPETEVRSGAGNSPQLYPTNRLRKGERVEVVQELPSGWLAIKPPPGSFSWINTRFVQEAIPGRGLWYVIGHSDERVPVRVGSELRTDPPTIEGARLARGTQLRAIGPVKSSSDGSWLPVEAPPSEVRYIRADQVARAPVGTAPAAGAPGNLVSDGRPAPPPPAAVTPPSLPATQSMSPSLDPRWAQARQADEARRYDEAIRLYNELGRQYLRDDQRLAMQALNRAHFLSDQRRREAAASPGTAGQDLPANSVTSPPGRLVHAGRVVDTQRTYVLENSQGAPVLYATPQSGFSLEPYVGRNLQLMGVRTYREDLRAYHMTVLRVQLLN